MRITYYALKTVQVGDEFRQPGDLVPEAQEWAYVSAYIMDGKIAPVLVATLPKKAQEELLRWEEDRQLAEEDRQLAAMMAAETQEKADA